MAARELPASPQPHARTAGNPFPGAFPEVRALLRDASHNKKTSLVAELEKVDMSGLVGVVRKDETVAAFAKRCAVCVGV